MPSAAAQAAGTSLKADLVALDVSASFAHEGIPSLIVRGPSVAKHLYDNDEVRGYLDVDFLVPQERVADASSTLERLGFVYRAVLSTHPDDRPPWASTWNRQDGGNVDLHWTLVGIGVEPSRVWSLLSEHAEPVDLLGAPVVGLDDCATCVVVALHAAHHGIEFEDPLEDLRRAAMRRPIEVWASAASLAARLSATEAFASGLRLVEEGAAVAARLNLPSGASAETILRASTAPPMALGFDWLAQTAGRRAKARLVAAKIAPSRAFMRSWFRPARGGGTIALMVGYVWRPIWLAWHAVPGFRAWRAAARAEREQPSAQGRR